MASEIRHSTETSLQDLSTINMVFSDEDKILIKSLHLKGYTAKRFTDEFPEKGWTKHGGSVATCLRCGGLCHMVCSKFRTLSSSAKILKIGEDLALLQTG